MFITANDYKKIGNTSTSERRKIMEHLLYYFIVGISFLMLVYLFLIYHRLQNRRKSRLKICGNYIIGNNDVNGSIELAIYNHGNYEVELSNIGLCCNKRYIVINNDMDEPVKIAGHSYYKLLVDFNELVNDIQKATCDSINLKIKAYALETDGRVNFGRGKHLAEIFEHYYYQQRIKEAELLSSQAIPTVTTSIDNESEQAAVISDSVEGIA